MIEVENDVQMEFVDKKRWTTDLQERHESRSNPEDERDDDNVCWGIRQGRQDR